MFYRVGLQNNGKVLFVHCTPSLLLLEFVIEMEISASFEKVYNSFSKVFDG